jgi:single-strand DNA-binding protein
MFETMVPIMGRVITDVAQRTLPSGDKVCSFRIVARERRLNRETGEWVDGDRLFVNVTCWRKLAENVAASLFRGDDVLTYGRLYLNEYEINGQPRSSVELDARVVGPDLSRCSALVQRPPRVDTTSDELVTPSVVAA